MKELLEVVTELNKLGSSVLNNVKNINHLVEEIKGAKNEVSALYRLTNSLKHEHLDIAECVDTLKEQLIKGK